MKYYSASKKREVDIKDMHASHLSNAIARTMKLLAAMQDELARRSMDDAAEAKLRPAKTEAA